MKYFVWDHTFETGVEEIDEQHMRLVEMINDLHDAMMIRQGVEILEPLLQSLIDYTKYHFQTEEGIYEKRGYPLLAAHQKEHEALTKQVEEFQNLVDSGIYRNVVSINTFLKKWLTEHILEKDLAAVRSFKK